MVLSAARSWIPLILRPHQSLRNMVDCFSSYDASAWDPQLELLDSGIKLGMNILIPALLFSLIGSFLTPSSSLGESIDHVELPSYIDVFSPYTRHSSALSSVSPPTSSSTLYYSLLSSNYFDLPYLRRLFALSIISPITLDILFHHIAPILIQVVSRLKFVLMSHTGPDASTKSALLEKVRAGRAIRRHAYDLFLPPKTRDAKLLSDNRNPITSLLFFPGFGIHHSAYADVASQISDYGIPVIVVSLEPLRLAHLKLGGGMDDVRRLIKSAGKEVVEYYTNNMREDTHLDAGKIERNLIVEWAIGGHSMGGYNALQLAEELVQSDREPPSVLLDDGSISRVGSQIVVWAAGNIVESVPNLQIAESSSLPLSVFILLASNDSIAKFSSQQQKREFLSKLPKKSRLETIKGGNHSGFASYDAASKKQSSTFLINGLRDIPLKSQHEEASRRTANFLLTK